MRQLFSTRSSTVSPRLHCSMSGFGMRTPLEFPMRTSSVFMVNLLSNYIVITSRMRVNRLRDRVVPKRLMRFVIAWFIQHLSVSVPPW